MSRSAPHTTNNIDHPFGEEEEHLALESIEYMSREKVISVQMLFSSKKNIIAQDKNDLDGLSFDLELLPVIKAFMDSQKWDCDVFYTDTSLRLVVSKKYERAVERQ